jgi:carbonic anhydrase
MAEAKKPRRGRRFPHPETPQEALAILNEGNRRYREGELQLRDYSLPGEDIADRQTPFAAIVTCADSRLSPPLVFDVHHGNLFVSRIAGNTIDTGTLGSTEFAVKVLGVKLVMVLGHSNCGAVEAAIAVANGKSSYSPDEYGSIGAVVERIVPPIQSVPPAERTLPICTSVNARAQAADIGSRGPIIEQAVEADQLAVAAAVYDIKSGKVTLL